MISKIPAVSAGYIKIPAKDRDELEDYISMYCKIPFISLHVAVLVDNFSYDSFSYFHTSSSIVLTEEDLHIKEYPAESMIYGFLC